MHNKFSYIWVVQNGSMKDLTIDWALRATWQAVTRMYNEEAKNYGLTMAIGFTLLSIDSKKGNTKYGVGTTNGNGINQLIENSKNHRRTRIHRTQTQSE